MPDPDIVSTNYRGSIQSALNDLPSCIRGACSPFQKSETKPGIRRACNFANCVTDKLDSVLLWSIVGALGGVGKFAYDVIPPTKRWITTFFDPKESPCNAFRDQSCDNFGEALLWTVIPCAASVCAARVVLPFILAGGHLACQKIYQTCHKDHAHSEQISAV
jgi:hypothetical protein